jgi:hypothetical protein
LIKHETSQANRIIRPAKRSHKEATEDENDQFNEEDFEKLSSKYADSEGNEKNMHNTNDDTGEVVISDDENFFENDDNFEDEDDDDEDEEDGDSITDSMSQ